MFNESLQIDYELIKYYVNYFRYYLARRVKDEIYIIEENKYIEKLIESIEYFIHNELEYPIYNIYLNKCIPDNIKEKLNLYIQDNDKFDYLIDYILHENPYLILKQRKQINIKKDIFNMVLAILEVKKSS